MAMPRSKGGRFAKREDAERTEQTDSPESAQPTDMEEPTVSDTVTEIEFVDELPKIHRSSKESGVWAERLQPVMENQGRWAKVFGPTRNAHATANNLRSGLAAGVDHEAFSFAARNLPDKLVDPETGKEYQEGYVFARYDTPEQRVEREQEQAERAAKRAATKAAKEAEQAAA